jgi:AbrB family looped-hinge helix DNA binding protein
MGAPTTCLSSKGQVVIPASVRRRLGLRSGEILSIDVAEPPERAVTLRALTTGQTEALLRKGYAWFGKTNRDLVEELHEARRTARLREKTPRRP